MERVCASGMTDEVGATRHLLPTPTIGDNRD